MFRSERPLPWPLVAKTALEVLIAPMLVALATLVGRRWGSRAGGLVSAFPAVVGPLLLIIAQRRGDPAAASAAQATLLGLVALSGFAFAYAMAARSARWPASLATGWACAIMSASLAGWSLAGAGFPAALTAAVLSLAAARFALRSTETDPHEGPLPQRPRGDVAVRMALTAALIVLLTALSDLFGPLVGGLLAALPVLASVLAVFTHRVDGPRAAIVMLRGMLTGMAGFVAFCAAIALLAAPAGTALAFVTATACAVAAQAFAFTAPPRPARLGRHRAPARTAT